MTIIMLFAALFVGQAAMDAEPADKPWLYGVAIALIVGASLILGLRRDR